MGRQVKLVLGLVVLVAVGGTVVARLFGYRLGPRTVVRCRQGHLFTTVWIPGIKLTSLDLGLARIQYCPVGRHWSLVTPLHSDQLTDEVRAQARAHHDLPIP